MTDGSPAISRAAVLELLRERLAAVLGVDPGDITEESRFDEDLHADSLDLVEVVESVERQLAARDVAVTLPEDDLVDARTVGDAADRIAAHAGQR